MGAWQVVMAAVLVALSTPPPARADAPAVLECSVPATLSVLYDADGAVSTAQMGAAGTLRVRVDAKPAQVVVDGKELPASGWRWERGGVSLSLAAGEHRIEINRARRDPKAGPPAVTLTMGKARTLLAVVQGAESTLAAGTFAGPTGRYRIRVEGSARPVQVSVGAALLSWSPGGPPSDVVLMKGAAVGVTLSGRRPPREVAVRLDPVGLSLPQQPEAAPAQQAPAGILVEAEAFARQGGGEVTISRGEHAGTHGGASLYNWGPAGHWLEWDVTVPKPGRYRLALAAAGQDPEAFVGVAIDGREPFAGAGLLAIPGTGGWGRSDPKQWRLFPLRDAAGEPASITLGEGRHLLRLTNMAGVHLNLDYLAIVPEGR